MPEFAALTVSPEGAISLTGMHPGEADLTYDEAFKIAHKAARKGSSAVVLTLWESGEGEGDSIQLCAYEPANVHEAEIETSLDIKRTINDGRKMHFTTYRYADVSTAYLTRKDNDILQELRPESCAALIAEYEEGYFINVPTDDSFFKSDVKRFKALGMSRSFLALFLELHQQGIPMVRFDMDAADVKGARQHNW